MGEKIDLLEPPFRFLAIFSAGFLINQQSQQKTENIVGFPVVSSLDLLYIIWIEQLSIEKMWFFQTPLAEKRDLHVQSHGRPLGRLQGRASNRQFLRVGGV